MGILVFFCIKKYRAKFPVFHYRQHYVYSFVRSFFLSSLRLKATYNIMTRKTRFSPYVLLRQISVVLRQQL